MFKDCLLLIITIWIWFFWKIDILTVFLCDFLVFEWIKIKLNNYSLTLYDIWCEMKYHKKL